MAAGIFPPERPAPPPAQRLALKVDVRTYRGTAEGVPRLVQVLRKHRAGATFLFNLGPDRHGAALLRQRGRLLRSLGEHSLLAHYGARTLFYGTLLPAPDVGRRCSDVMRSVRDSGFEVGVHAWDSARWRRFAATADAEWTAREMRQALERFHAIFGADARVHGAAGWQMNRHAWRLTQRLGFDYCSDTRGTHPFLPVVDAELIACPQLPTTLPTLGELLARGDMGVRDAVALLAKAVRTLPAPAGHVYTLRAELEGMKLLPAFETLLAAWRAAGIECLTLGAYAEAAAGADLPRHCVQRSDAGWAVQGPEFLA